MADYTAFINKPLINNKIEMKPRTGPLKRKEFGRNYPDK